MPKQLHLRAPGLTRTRVAMIVLGLAAFGSVAQASSAQAEASRSTLVHFTNNSDSALTLTHEELDHGTYPEGGALNPPHQIAIGQTVSFEAESDGFATGDEFQLDYQLANKSTLHLSYDNPFVGSNSYVENAPQGYRISRTGGSGDNATVNQNFGCTSTVCDGIPDEWKEKGVTINPGGGNPPQFVNLPEMGVSLDRPTVMIQLDWMEDTTHDQALRQEAIDNVIRAYSEDPVTYKGATRSGITLVVDAGPNSTITPGGKTWGSLSRAKAVPWTADFLGGSRNAGYELENFYTLVKNDLVAAGRLPMFHYSIAVGEIAPKDSTSGFTPGSTPAGKLGFIVSLGDWKENIGSEEQQNGTFMHEMGHDLGLLHGGEDSVNYKPNYPSIMNYDFQMEGVPRNGKRVWDYSRDEEPSVNESTLTEAGGVNLGTNASGYGTAAACFKAAEENPEVLIQNTLAPVNWTCTGKPALGTGFDANGDNKQEVLNGAKSDWSRIDFVTGGVGAGTNASETVTVPSSGISEPSDEVTTQIQSKIRSLPLSTKVTYTGATTTAYHETATVSATLVDPDGGSTPIAEKTISFQLGSSSSDACSAITDSSGKASCTITATQTPGPYSVVASFAGDSTYKAGSDTQPFTITRAKTTLSYNGPSHVANGSATTFTGTLLENGKTPPSPSGQTVTFTLGSGASAQNCSGTVAANGSVQCTIANVHQPDSATFTVSVGAAFAGDAFYEPSNSPPGSVQLLFYSARAYGSSLTLLALKPQVVADTGEVRTAQETAVVKNGIALAVGGVKAAVPTAAVRTGGGGAIASASASTFSLSGLSVPTIQASTITVTSKTTCAGSTASLTLASLKINGTTYAVKGAAPNTVIHLLLGGTVTLNQQIPAPGPDHGLTVNALHVSIPHIIDYVQSSATTGIHNCP
jgi:hypothetical protein